MVGEKSSLGFLPVLSWGKGLSPSWSMTQGCNTEFEIRKCIFKLCCHELSLWLQASLLRLSRKWGLKLDDFLSSYTSQILWCFLTVTFSVWQSHGSSPPIPSVCIKVYIGSENVLYKTGICIVLFFFSVLLMDSILECFLPCKGE